MGMGVDRLEEGLEDLLEAWTSELAPLAAVHAPQSLRKQIVSFIQNQLRRATGATLKREQAHQEADGMEQSDLGYSLWTFRGHPGVREVHRKAGQ